MNSNLEINLQLLKARWGDRFDYHEFHQWVQGHLLEIDFAAYDLLFQCWNVAYLRGVESKKRDVEDSDHSDAILG